MLEELEDDDLVDELDEEVFWDELEDLFSLDDSTFMHFVLSEFNSYPSSHFSQIVDSGHFLQFGIDLHFLASVKINDSSKTNNNILNFLYFPNKDIKN